MLRDYFQQIFNNYQRDKKGKFIGSPMVKLITEDFPEYLKEIKLDSNDYIFKGDAGEGNFTECPYIAILDSKVATGVESGYYVIYIFSKDTKRLYLSLNQGNLKSNSLTPQEYKDLSLKASEFRKKIGDIPDKFNLETLSLGNPTFYSRYEIGNICAKEYSIENLPSEEELEADLKEILSLYKLLSANSITENDNLNIKIFLDTILKSYSGVKSKGDKVKGHHLSSVFNEFAKNLKKFVNSNQNFETDRYQTKSVHFGQKKFVNGPYVYLYDITRRKQFYIGYMFREDMKGVYIVLNIKGADIDREFEKNEENFDSKEEFDKYYLNTLRIEINKKSKISDKFDQSSKGAWFNKRTIYAKYYEKNNLPSNKQLIKDLINILSLYKVLVPPYNQMITLSDINEIKKAQELFKKRFEEVTDQTIMAKTQNSEWPLLWSSKLNIWGYFGSVTNHYFNPFGIGNPDLNSDNQTIIEINSPHEGINRNTSGVFALDNSGKLFLLNRGKFHGKQIQKEEYIGEWVEVVDGDQKNELILIGGLEEPDFPEKLKNFIYEVYKIKNGETNLNNQNFFDYLNEKGYLFNQKLVENFLLSLKVKPFVILTGNSGTGKTKLAQLFAQYLSRNNQSKKYVETYQDVNSSSIKYTAWTLNKDALKQLNINYNKKYDIKINDISTTAELISPRLKYDDPDKKIQSLLKKILKENSNKNIKIEILISNNDSSKYEIVPVGANWTENRHIVGFYNVITEKYQKTSSLNLILDAKNDLTEPYFLILDEMNLSHVERYFSDFLSVMESQETMPLHNNKEKEISPLEDNEKIGVPRKLDLPPNLLVIGTVNVDETTYMFSPKVLDRANTIEFLTHSPLEFLGNQINQPKPSGNLEYLQNPLSDTESNIQTCSIDDLKELMKNIKTKENKVLWDVVSEEINKIYTELKKAGFDFGFRVINEIMRFMYVAWKYEGELLKWENWERYFDAQIKQKMLPKIHGSQRTLQEVINNLFEMCYGSKIDIAPRLLSEKELINAKYHTAALKLREMDKVLYEQRYVAFIN